MKGFIIAGVILLTAGSVAYANSTNSFGGVRLTDKEMAAVKGSGAPYWAGVYAPNPYWIQSGCGVACKPAGESWGDYRSAVRGPATH